MMKMAPKYLARKEAKNGTQTAYSYSSFSERALKNMDGGLAQEGHKLLSYPPTIGMEGATKA